MRHAFVAAASRIGIGGPADRGLLGVIELAAARRRQEIHAGAGESDAEKHGVVDLVAAVDAFVGKETAADNKILADPVAHRGIDVKRQPHAIVPRAAIAVIARIGAREE